MSRLVINKVSEEPEKEYIKSAKKLLLGRKRPPLFTRVILGIALVAFVYYFIWNGLKMILFTPGSIEILDDPDKFIALINELGKKFDISDPMSTFLLNAQIMVAAWAIILIGMLIIYRRKITGYYIFFFGLLVSLVTPFAVLGWDYATSPSDGTDLLDHIVPVALFIIFFISFKRLKKLKEEARKEALLQL